MVRRPGDDSDYHQIVKAAQRLPYSETVNPINWMSGSSKVHHEHQSLMRRILYFRIAERLQCKKKKKNHFCVF